MKPRLAARRRQPCPEPRRVCPNGRWPVTRQHRVDEPEELLDHVHDEALPPKRREEVDRRLWWGYKKLGRRRAQAGEYEGAVDIGASIQALEGPNANPACRTRLYTHGHRTERALVLLHGFTNCPAQFDALGRQWFERGWNVLIPRYPRHGYSDRLITSIAAGLASISMNQRPSARHTARSCAPTTRPGT